ncbi:site-specific integrase [uncultured Dysosmobacter sp.]|uniref:tyrosine-type recombinase/integrase n=1 Tax=uncultured Dysosmobacter sp. TaxID=2591384 RepID=UPI00260F874D|nr:site-specific integrase [uncultured Dysosmobacter sp.]
MARKDYVTKTLSLPNGKRKYIYGKTEAEAEEKLQEAKMLLRAGIDLGDDTTFGEYAQMWYNVYKKPKLRENSKASITNALNVHILPYLSALKMQDVTPMAIQSCLNHLSNSSKSLYGTVLQCLRAIFDSAVDDNLIIRSPVPKRLKNNGVTKKKLRALTIAQEEILLTALEGTTARLFVWFLSKTGLRRGEALAVMRDALEIADPDNAVVKVHRTLVFIGTNSILQDTTKTPAGYREVPLPRDLAIAIKGELCKSNSMFLFHKRNGEMLTETAFRGMWSAVTARKTPPPLAPGEKAKPNKHPWVKRIIDFKVTPHILRHTYATRCIEKGMDPKEVQYLLGHTDPTITMRIYADYCEDQQREITFPKVRKAMELPSEAAN